MRGADAVTNSTTCVTALECETSVTCEALLAMKHQDGRLSHGDSEAEVMTCPPAYFVRNRLSTSVSRSLTMNVQLFVSEEAEFAVLA
jgi:hypothetical protein